MDDRLHKAVEHANYKATLAIQKDNAKVRLATDLLYATGGGIFTITPTLMNFVDLLVRQGQMDAVLIDDKGKPIAITDLQAMLDTISMQYAEATNAYLAEYDRLRKARSIKAIVDVNV